MVVAPVVAFVVARMAHLGEFGVGIPTAGPGRAPDWRRLARLAVVVELTIRRRPARGLNEEADPARLDRDVVRRPGTPPTGCETVSRNCVAMPLWQTRLGGQEYGDPTPDAVHAAITPPAGASVGAAECRAASGRSRDLRL